MPRRKEVDAWFAKYDNPMKDVVQRVREIILDADPRIDECIKWQAPTFTYDGNLASFFPKAKQHASLMFHTGSTIPGKHPRLEGTGVGPFESATVRIDPTGKVYVASGACPQGQGMETIFSQVVADAWKVKPDDVVMALADTSAISIGFGTIASRSTVTLSAAIHYASEILREKAFAT